MCKFFNSCNNIFYLFLIKLWKHGQRHQFPRDPLADRKTPLFVAQVPVGAGQVQGHGIVNARGNSFIAKGGHKLIAPAVSYGINMIDMLCIASLMREHDTRQALKQLIVLLCMLPAGFSPGWQDI